MRRSPAVQIARTALRDPDKGYVQYILSSVNLTLLEREIVEKSEIHGIDIESICMGLDNWKKKNDCSYYNCARIKRSGMLKIAEFINSLKYK